MGLSVVSWLLGTGEGCFAGKTQEWCSGLLSASHHKALLPHGSIPIRSDIFTVFWMRRCLWACLWTSFCFKWASSLNSVLFTVLITIPFNSVRFASWCFMTCVAHGNGILPPIIFLTDYCRCVGKPLMWIFSLFLTALLNSFNSFSVYSLGFFLCR